MRYHVLLYKIEIYWLKPAMGLDSFVIIVFSELLLSAVWAFPWKSLVSAVLLSQRLLSYSQVSSTKALALNSLARLTYYKLLILLYHVQCTWQWILSVSWGFFFFFCIDTPWLLECKIIGVRLFKSSLLWIKTLLPVTLRRCLAIREFYPSDDLWDRVYSKILRRIVQDQS